MASHVWILSLVLTSQLADPASPLLKINKVNGVSATKDHRVSIKLTWTQNATITAMRARMLSTMAKPQKSSLFRFALVLV